MNDILLLFTLTLSLRLNLCMCSCTYYVIDRLIIDYLLLFALYCRNDEIQCWQTESICDSSVLDGCYACTVLTNEHNTSLLIAIPCCRQLKKKLETTWVWGTDRKM